MQDKWVKIGEIGVDAGLIWIGDPCYILHKPKKELPKSIGKNWDDFCEKITELTNEFTYDFGHPGLGVCVQSGYGDGVYDVEANFEDDRVKEVRIKFF